MNLLSYLVPALREVRAPLIGGYLWLLLGWLWASHLVPSEGEQLAPGSVFATLSRLQEVIGPAGLLIALSVAAYLVGSLAGEFINSVLGRLGTDPDRLTDAVAVIPGFEHAAETVRRLHAEGELRFHVALPLIGVAGTIGRTEDITAGSVVAFFSAAILVQGVLLLRRAAKVHHAVERAVDQHQAEMSEYARQQQRADVRVRRSGVDRLALHNDGPETAHDLDLTLADGSHPHFILGELLPIKELRQGDTVELPVIRSIGDPVATEISVSWIDPSGRQENVQTIHWT